MNECSHPKILLFHLLFRTGAIIIYLFSSLFSSTIIPAILVITLNAFDFWTVKNVSGRLLVGLRWWNDPSQAQTQGGSQWRFESRQPSNSKTANSNGNNNYVVNKTDSRVFWYSLYMYHVIWIILFIISLIRLNFMWSVIALVAITLGTANIAGFTRCDKDAKARLKGIQGMVGQGFVSGLMGRLF